MTTETLATGEQISCFPPNPDIVYHPNLSFETYVGRVLTTVTEFDPSTLRPLDDGTWSADAPDGPLRFGTGGGDFLQSTCGSTYRAAVIKNRWVVDVYEPSVDYADVWLPVRVCGHSPYPHVMRFLNERGERSDLPAASAALLNIHGQGDRVEQTTAAFQDWINKDGSVDRVAWVDQDPTFRSFDNAPPQIEEELVPVDMSLRVPSTWRESSSIICLRTLGGWSGCIDTTAVDGIDNEAFGLPLDGYRLAGEDVSIVLVDSANPAEATIVVLGAITAAELDQPGLGPLTATIATKASPESILSTGTTDLEFTTTTEQ